MTRCYGNNKSRFKDKCGEVWIAAMTRPQFRVRVPGQAVKQFTSTIINALIYFDKEFLYMPRQRFSVNERR